MQKKSSTLGWYLGFVPRDLKAHLTGGNTEIAQPPCRRTRSDPGVLTHLFCPSSAKKENLIPSRVWEAMRAGPGEWPVLRGPDGIPRDAGP